MTATHTPGLPIVENGLLVSTNPATGEEVARVPIAGPEDVAAAVDRARAAAAWWTGLGFAAAAPASCSSEASWPTGETTDGSSDRGAWNPMTLHRVR